VLNAHSVYLAGGIDLLVRVYDTLMVTLDDRGRVASPVLDFVGTLKARILSSRP
jgi:hypothetical protein